jgi:hypothetical protein
MSRILTLFIEVNTGSLATIEEAFWWWSQISDHQLE